MKKTIAIITALFVLATISFSAAAKDLKVAFVNMPKVFEASKAYQEVQKKMNNDKAFYDAKLKKMEDDFKKKQASGASQAELQKLYQDLQTKAMEYSQTLQKDATTKSNVVLEDIRTKITAYAKNKGYDFILTDAAVIYVNDQIDITDEIIALINKK